MSEALCRSRKKEERHRFFTRTSLELCERLSTGPDIRSIEKLDEECTSQNGGCREKSEGETLRKPPWAPVENAVY